MKQLKLEEPRDFEKELRESIFRELQMARKILPSNPERVKLIKKVREKLNLSQVKFANYMHISRRTLQNWEYQISPVPDWFFNQLYRFIKKIDPNFLF